MNAVAAEVLPSGVSIRVARATARVEAELPEPAPQRTRARDAALIYAENRLSPWAKWAREHRDAIGYPTISLLYKAMQSTKVGIIRGTAIPFADYDNHGEVVYPVNADGSETRSMRPREVGEVPEAIAEVDVVVARLPRDLHTVIVADYFTYGPLDIRARQTPWKPARFRQLLEAAKYAVYVGLT